ncbi:SpoIIE family protein phosphatase [Candidatus Fermentibacteria bacterium]|nr:SpoIIE family protein phosphatase [Candidatus Fermentibacteria bacterium]
MHLRIMKTGMIVMAVVSVVLAGLYLVRDFTKVATMVRMGDIWSMVQLSDAPSSAFIEVDRRDFPEPPFPVAGDTLLTIDGKAVSAETYFTIFTTHTAPGSRHGLTFLHDGQVFTTDAVTRAIPLPLKIQVVALHVLTVVFTLGLLGIGIWAYATKPSAAAVRVMTLLCLTMALSSLMSRSGVAGAYATFQLPRVVFNLIGVIGLFSGAFWVHLQLVFPTKASWCAGHRGQALITLYGPLAASLLLRLAPPPVREPAIQTVVTSYWLLGFFLLSRNHRQAASLLQRRQTRLVLWGSAPAVLTGLAIGWSGVLAGPWFRSLPYATKLAVLNVNSLLLVFIPLSVGYAFGKYRLLEVETKLKRGTRFLLTTGATVVLLLAACAVLYLGASRLFAQLGVRGEFPPNAVAVVLALGFLPAHFSLRRSLENRIYPERARLHAMLQGFLQQPHTSRSFWLELAQQLRDGIGASAVYPLLRRRDALPFAVECCELAPFRADDQFSEAVLKARHPLPMDEIVASGRVPLTGDQREWLSQRDAALIVPLATVSGLRGILVVSARLEGDDYAPEELEILRVMATQIALVAETIELLEERVERQRLQEEIRLARQIQEGLLPGNLPVTPGLETAAHIRFSTDVAGDYYDVIPLDRDRTLVAVGDVTGKGMGAALIMSNLQAALRAIGGVDLPLSQAVGQINSLIHDNTPSDLFITVFVAVYDSRTGDLTYVNAGHDPPIVCTAGGEIRRLPATGLLIGVIRGTAYHERRVHLNPGDLLFVYTDGASEAMNDDEEEFGDARLAALVAAHREAPLSRMLATVEEEVRRFHGGRPLQDDVTLLAVRRLLETTL